MQRVAAQKAVLSYFFSGNIDDHETVEFWTTSPIPKPRVLQMFKNTVVPMLIPSACPVFPRSRWIGGEFSVSWAGVLSCLHNLLQPLLVKWGAPDGFAKQEPRRPALTLKDFSEGWKDVASKLPATAGAESAAILDVDPTGWDIH